MATSPVPDHSTGVTDATVVRVDAASATREIDDWVAVEEPLEIQIRAPGMDYRSVSVTMRTPGNDRELAAGFLFNEGLVESADDILEIAHWGPLQGDNKVRNILRVDLRSVPTALARMERHFYASSACGVCGKATLAAIRRPAPQCSTDMIVSSEVVRQLPMVLHSRQQAFFHTGGLHATAISDASGAPRHVFEDVGRHNALDKAAGAMLFEGALPAHRAIVVVSGRIGYELVQKTIRMGCPILCAIGAPSSLAVEVARAARLTLVGFVREQRFNIYSAAGRIKSE